MKLKLTRCTICGHWYSPAAHNHCELCGAFSIKVLRPVLAGQSFVILRPRKAYIDIGNHRTIKPELVSGIYNISRFVQPAYAE